MRVYPAGQGRQRDGLASRATPLEACQARPIRLAFLIGFCERGGWAKGQLGPPKHDARGQPGDGRQDYERCSQTRTLTGEQPNKAINP